MSTTGYPANFNISIVLPPMPTQAESVGGSSDVWRNTSATENGRASCGPRGAGDAGQPSVQANVTCAPAGAAGFTELQSQFAGLAHEAAELRAELAQVRGALAEACEELSHFVAQCSTAARNDGFPPRGAGAGADALAEAGATRIPSARANATRTPSTERRATKTPSAAADAAEFENRSQIVSQCATPGAGQQESAEQPGAPQAAPQAPDASVEADAAARLARGWEFLRKHAARPKPQPMPIGPDDTDDPDVTAGYAVPRLDNFPVTVRQQHVMIHLLAGYKMAEAAKAGGVSRSTVHRWRRRNPHFRALFNTHQNEMIESGRAKLVTMIDNACNNTNAQILAGNYGASRDVLKGMGLLTGRAPELRCETAAELAATGPDPTLPTDPPLFPHRQSLNGHAHNGHAAMANGHA